MKLKMKLEYIFLRNPFQCRFGKLSHCEPFVGVAIIAWAGEARLVLSLS